MVDGNWRCDVVCAVILFLILNMKYWGQDNQWFILNFCDPFLKVLFNCSLVGSNFFSQIAGFINSGFVIFFITGGSEFPFSCSPLMVLNPYSSSLRKCNACTVCFKYLLLSGPDAYFQSWWEGWMLERDSVSWPRHQYRLAVLTWVKRLHQDRSIESCNQ